MPVPSSAQYDPKTGIFTFEDGSQAKMLTRSVPCEPYIAASTTTMQTKPVKYWFASDFWKENVK